MTASRVWLLALACWILSPAVSAPMARAQQPPPRELAIAFVERSGDARYQAATGYAGLYRPEHVSPFAAAELALKDGMAAARARGLKLNLLRKSLSETEDAVSSLRALLEAQGVVAAILDLPADDMLRLAKGLADDPVVLFNARQRDDGLRSQTCHTHLLHTLL